MKKSEIATLIVQAEALRPPYSPADMLLIRQSFGMSQSEFAKLLRVEKSWVFKREQGATGMSASDTALVQAVLYMRRERVIMGWIGGALDRAAK